MGTGYYGGFGNTSGADRNNKAEADRNNKAKADRNNKAEADRNNKAEADRNNKTGAERDKPKPVLKKKVPIFNDNGHVTLESIKARAEFFLGKSVARLEKELHKYGYETMRRPSTHSTSKAKIIETLNGNKDRNISQIQVSPGSKRHGDVPYVKISTTDCGKIKIIDASPSEYKSDGRETAELIFRRDKK